MTARVSARTARITTCSYDDFPVGAGGVDLRGDGVAPLAAATAALNLLAARPDVLGGYGDVAGDPGLRALLGEVFAVDAGQVVVTAGGSEALHLAFLCTTDPGDTVLLPRPAFPGFDELAHLTGLLVSHYLVPGPIPTTDAAVTVVCSPHNPTGVITAPEDVPTAGGWVIWDACHLPLTGPHLAKLRERQTQSDVLVFSLSKLLRLPGARIGCLIARDPGLVAAAVAAKTHLSMSSSRPAQQLAARVLAAPGTRPELATRHQRLADARARLTAGLYATGAFTVQAADAGSFLLASCVDGGDAWKQLAHAGVVGLPGTVFGAPATAVRLCVSQPAPVITAALARLAAR